MSEQGDGSQAPARPDRSARAAWALSGAAHLAVIVLAFFVVWTVTPGEQDVTPAHASFDDPGLAPSPRAETSELAEADAQPVELELEPEPIEIEPEVSLSDLLRDLDDAEEVMVIERTTAPIERAALMEQRRFPEVRFAGTGASNAERIVYVVDGSGSLLGAPIRKIVKELTSSISKLSPTQRFQVIFFLDAPDGSRGYAICPPPYASEKAFPLIRATREGIAHATQWCESINASGRGDPLEALETAFQFKPDAIFLLARFTGLVSDPETARVLTLLDRLNPRVGRAQNRAVTINAIQFLEPDPRGTLEAIAREHGGPDALNAYKLLPLNAQEPQGRPPR